ncbi:hypothetical protein GGR43_003128 [Sphingobium jiangsuense]|uniref:Uncharacterized protein n=1 Tax=Sphingobium jiangsuense TaxID=870476 RepID=A0A7W6BT65_9SPHN|nr:hypothetical protein [Sphingobium jiangsuense]MBB3927399.1 hypothetical protein [Sphingobium jiangsuense]
MDLDDIHDVDDYSDATLRAMIDRLERSTTEEQFIYRETELDEMWRLVDIRLIQAEGEERAALLVLKEAIMRAHDLVGMEGKPMDAARLLRALGR